MTLNAWKGTLYSMRLWGDTSQANHWKCYPKPAYFTVTVLSRWGVGVVALPY